MARKKKGEPAPTTITVNAMDNGYVRRGLPSARDLAVARARPPVGSYIVLPLVFHAVLRFEGISRTRSGLFFWWEDVLGVGKTPAGAGLIYPMPANAMTSLLKNVELVGVGLADGRWKWMKHGGYAGLWPALPEEV